ncbi:hypothetical protein HUO13_02400 [Saccharopolyspora erythraea]|uniref:hypothetical protein n=1 Tax=Saccharopolyspora erythraea TaxID=1836 RepID=UPI001BAA6F6F|nr:hypothetical protein [Saccharopolyspora erythraea]QUG99802.1 hypothetical protein HUO13_02400 [Saccharopolyspora erythraea]
MTDPRTEIDHPARILTGIGGLNQKFSTLGWEGLFSRLIAEIEDSQRRLAAAIDEASE